MRRLSLFALAGAAMISSGTKAQEVLAEPFSAVARGPAPGRGNYFLVEGAEVDGDLDSSFGASLGWAGRSLRVVACPDGGPTDSCTNRREIDAVNGSLELHAWYAITFGNRAQVALDLPFGAVTGDSYRFASLSGQNFVLDGGTRFGLGDPRLSAKVTLVGQRGDAFHLAVSASSTLPVAQAMSDASGVRNFFGNDGPTLGAQAVVSYVSGRLHLAGNLGGLLRRSRTLFDTDANSQLTYAMAAGYAFDRDILLFAELDGAADFTAGVDGYPLEARLVGRYDTRHAAMQVGFGARLTKAAGSPAIRIFGSFAWHPLERETDSDGDGVLHQHDACPTEAEDLDGFEDEDGCPDLDNDDDGIPDTADLCHESREDHDGDSDADGCHDHDGDGDGIEDGYDGCPTQREDVDGDRDADGCPD